MNERDIQSRPAAGDTDYDQKGHGYALQRRADPRIARYVHAALGNARSVLNVGAGAGSYEPTDRYVLAVEPSRTMRMQRPAGSPPAINAVAELLPFDDRSVDAAMALITIHQWRDLRKGLAELLRVTRESIVVLTFDGIALERYWLGSYVPELVEAERSRYVAIETLGALLAADGRSVEIQSVPIPGDCTDGIIEAFYSRPERFLEEAVRRAQSSWNFVAPGVEERFCDDLRADLDSGKWDEKYESLRRQPLYDGSLRVIVSRPTRSDGRFTDNG